MFKRKHSATVDLTGSDDEGYGSFTHDDSFVYDEGDDGYDGEAGNNFRDNLHSGASYTIIPQKDIRSKQQAEINEFATLADITSSEAGLLLKELKWNSRRLQVITTNTKIGEAKLIICCLGINI